MLTPYCTRQNGEFPYTLSTILPLSVERGITSDEIAIKWQQQKGERNMAFDQVRLGPELPHRVLLEDQSRLTVPGVEEGAL